MTEIPISERFAPCGVPVRTWPAALLGVAIVLALLSPTVRAQTMPPDFAFQTYRGEEVLGATELHFHELLGRGKPVVLNFWAPLCPPCRQEMPGFQRIHDELGGDFLLVGMDVGSFISLGTHQQAEEFLRDHDITYPTGYALSIDPVRDYGVRGMPTTVFIAADGSYAGKHTGYLSEGELRERILELLENKQ